MKHLLVTGSSGLIGSEVAEFFCKLGWQVQGIDNNMRANFFGIQGDTRRNQARLEEKYSNFKHIELDIRNRLLVSECLAEVKPDLIVHAAAQPSHDLAASRPYDDFEVNTSGTLNLIESTRHSAPNAVFVYMSTNKVYGDKPNFIPLKELDSRWDYEDPHYKNGITENFTIDQSKHSLFGASKLAADIYIQEYGRYFNMKTCCLRGGCLTGQNHSGVEMHGFLSYLIKCNVENRLYKIYGYKGKQVRDNIHSIDVARFIYEFYNNPRCGEVYNIGGGRKNSCSILEAFDKVSALSGQKMNYEYVDENRIGDHICYISDLSKMKTHYPNWDLSQNLDEIFEKIYLRWMNK